MFKIKIILSLVLICFLPACGTLSLYPIASPVFQTPTAEATVTSTAVPNIYLLAYAMREKYGNFEVVLSDNGLEQVVFTDGPTFEMVDGKLVEIASEKLDEHDLNPRFVMEIDQEYLGINIKASLITDNTLPVEAKITLPESTYAQYICRVIFWAWWANGTSEKHTGMATEKDYSYFMTLWKTAQQSNSDTDWKKVEFTTYGNDLNDGKGYVQEQMTFWPMHSGVTPVGVLNIDQLSIAVLDGTLVNNIDIVGTDYTAALGTNLDGENLYLYIGLPMEYGFYSLLSKNIASGLSVAPYWLGRNGKSSKLPSENKSLKSFLLNGGIQTGVTWEMIPDN